MDKSSIREMVWRMLEERGVARFPRPVYGRIPNFVGAERSAEKILMLNEYREARVIKVNPDSPQRLIRQRCLEDGKLLVMPTPRIRQGFLLLNPSKIPRSLIHHASTIKGAFKLGEPIHPSRLPKIDMIVVGSVAASRNGVRIGKGEGYAEIEYAILRELGKVDEDVFIATNIHDLQLIDNLPREPYDLTLDYIATPTKQIKIQDRPPRPPGILWDKLDQKKLEEIPLLKELKNCKNNPRF